MAVFRDYLEKSSLLKSPCNQSFASADCKDKIVIHNMADAERVYSRLRAATT